MADEIHCPACMAMNVPGQKPIIDVSPNGIAFCSACAKIWTPRQGDAKKPTTP